MTDLLSENSVIEASKIEFEHAPAENILEGTPHTGEQTLVHDLGVEIGIWEITPGVVTDIEVDETSIILSGSGTVELVETGEILKLSGGTVLRLKAGTRTKWTIVETLRKVYVVEGE